MSEWVQARLLSDGPSSHDMIDISGCKPFFLTHKRRSRNALGLTWISVCYKFGIRCLEWELYERCSKFQFASPPDDSPEVYHFTIEKVFWEMAADRWFAEVTLYYKDNQYLMQITRDEAAFWLEDSGYPIPYKSPLPAAHLATNDQDRDHEPEIKVIPGPAVVLGRVGAKPTVFGKELDVLTPARHNVIQALLKVWPEGLSKDELPRKSGHRDAVNVIKTVKKLSDEWNAAVLTPGRSGRGLGYRIAATSVAIPSHTGTHTTPHDTIPVR